jgi:L-ascorbate metabolism protein UlaG (beta-lactamase superfamily)
MEIIWYGHSCFRIKDRDATIVTDPFSGEIGLEEPRIKADVVTISHSHPGHSNTRVVPRAAYVIDGPGEYEVGGVFITGLATYHDAKKGSETGRNTIFAFELDGMTVCHLGDLGHLPTQATTEALGEISVLLVPVGGGSLRASQAAELVGALEPRIVIPMHYRLDGLKFALDPVSKFLKEMGTGPVEPIESLKIGAKDLPESTQVVLLQPRFKGKADE